MIPGLVPWLLALAAAFAGTVWTLGRLIAHQREHHRAAWEADGSPAGPFGSWPARADFRRNLAELRPALSTQVALHRWLVATPSWAERDARARFWFRLHRGFAALWILGVLAFASYFLWLHPPRFADRPR